MRVNDERWGRHSLGHSFQEDCRYEHAVPSDGSLAAPAAQEGLQLPFFTQESAFLSLFQESRSESSSISIFHGDVTALASYWDIFAKQKIHKAVTSQGDRRQGCTLLSLLTKLGGSGRQRESWESLQLLMYLGERASCNPSVMPNQTIIIFNPQYRREELILLLVKKSKGFKLPTA